MKKTILTLMLALGTLITSLQAQNLFFTRNGHVNFFSSTKMEDIKADNDKVTSIVNVTTGEIEFSLLINAFQFEKALMQEHFNENYMESSKYPKSTYKGKITNLDSINFGADGSYPAEVTGDLTIHGVSQTITTRGTINVNKGKLSIASHFMLSPADFKIEIPNLVKDNIAREIKVTVANSYEPFPG